MFKKATKKQSKLRLAIAGTSGAGKTYTALRIASGMGDKIALIDTEYGSASKYAGNFNFDTLALKEPTIDNYIKAIQEAGKLSYEILIIDSLSHAWDFLLEEVDRISKAKYHGNSFRGWSEGTPLQKKFINSILACPCHVIVTMRVKTEYVVESNDKGKMAPRKVGLSPRQREGLEYEFDMLMECNNEHYFTVVKDRTGKYQDMIIEKPTEEFGKELIEWLNEGEKVLSPQELVQAKLDLIYDNDKGAKSNKLLSLSKNQIKNASKLDDRQANYVLKELEKEPIVKEKTDMPVLPKEEQEFIDNF